MKLPMAIASIYYRSVGANNSVWTHGGAFAGATIEEAAKFAEGARKNMMPNYEYRILCGEFTHEIQPPEPVQPRLIPYKA